MGQFSVKIFGATGSVLNANQHVISQRYKGCGIFLEIRASYDSHDAALSAFVKGDCDLAWVPANVATAFLDMDGNAGDYQAFWLPADGQ